MASHQSFLAHHRWYSATTCMPIPEKIQKCKKSHCPAPYTACSETTELTECSSRNRKLLHTKDTFSKDPNNFTSKTDRSSVRTKIGNNYTRFKQSVYFVPSLLITTFLVFMVVPDLTYLFFGIVSNQRSPQLLAACFVSYAVSSLTDACIYIFLQRDVRQLLNKKLPLLKCNRRIWWVEAENVEMKIFFHPVFYHDGKNILEPKNFENRNPIWGFHPKFCFKIHQFWNKRVSSGSLVPAAAVIPAPIALLKVAAVKKLVVEYPASMTSAQWAFDTIISFNWSIGRLLWTN